MLLYETMSLLKQYITMWQKSQGETIIVALIHELRPFDSPLFLLHKQNIIIIFIIVIARFIEHHFHKGDQVYN